jgi:hypothetical protein
MTNYLRFASGEGEAADVLVEVDAAEDLPAASEQNAGLRKWARNQAARRLDLAHVCNAMLAPFRERYRSAR